MNSTSLLCLKFLALVGMTTLTGCASSPVPTLEPVGPKPPGVSSTGPMQGYLKVYTATDSFNDGDLMYYPHSEYAIYNHNGSRLKYVANHLSKDDESPEVAAVPAGSYYILAKSEYDGLVRVPVLIKGGETTVVNLEGAGKRNTDTQGADSPRVVKSPSGHVVGWGTSSS